MRRSLPWFFTLAISASLPAQQSPAPAPGPDERADGAPRAKGRIEYFSLESKLLAQTLEVGVYLPAEYDGGEERFPTLYFLHGLFGSARKWEERGTQHQLDELIADGRMPPTLVVCFDGRNSMYVNWVNGKGAWCDFIATELVQTIDSKFRTLATRGSRGINGDSMGGYGALNVAFKHPDVFGSVSAHSAAIYPVDPAALPEWVRQRGQQWAPIYGWPVEEAHWKLWNPLHLAAETEAAELRKLAIYFDCGDQDRFGFDKTNEQLHEKLAAREVPHEWHLRTGGHGRDYFGDNVQFSFLFHGSAFDAARSAKPAGQH